jgi:hypothetical protein
MRAKSTTPLVFFALSACGHAAPPPAAPPRSAPVALAPAELAPPRESSTPSAHTVGGADRVYDSLDATSAAELEVHRQVAELRRAVLLYQQFIERAEGEPTMAAAVRKSRERIEDACDTIVFLLQSSAPFNPNGC